MSRLVKVALAAVAGVSLAACGGDDEGPAGAPAGTIEVAGTAGLRFEPERFVVPAGEKVTVELRAQGVEHDFTIEGAGDGGGAHDGMDMESEGDHHGGEQGDPAPGDLHVVHADRGATEAGSFTIDEPGTYTVYCSVPGHRQAGMEATLEVVTDSQ